MLEARKFLGRQKQLWPLVPVLLFLGIFVVFPVADLLSVSFTDSSGRPSLETFRIFLQRPVYMKVLRTTFVISAWTTLICLLLAYPVAYYLASSSERARNNLLLIVLMPFWTGFLVRTFAWMILLAKSGPLVRLAEWIGVSDLELAYNLTGVLIGMSHALLPLAVLNMLPVMQGIDRRLMPAASVLGARPSEAFWRIYFPLSLPGVAASGLLVFITALGFFITPTILGGPQETMIAQVIIVQIQELLNWRFAGVLSFVLLLSALVVYYIYDRILGISTIVGEQFTAKRGYGVAAGLERYSSLVGRGILGLIGRVTATVGKAISRARVSGRMVGGSRHHLQGAVAGLVLVFLALPTFFVIPVSFTQSTFLDFPPRGFTLRWYVEFMQSNAWTSATLRSLTIALIVAIVAMPLGGAAAFVLAREAFRGKKLLMALVLSPLILPRMVIAVSLFYLMARMHIARYGPGTGDRPHRDCLALRSNYRDGRAADLRSPVRPGRRHARCEACAHLDPRHAAANQGQRPCSGHLRLHDVVRRSEHRTFSVRRGAEHAAKANVECDGAPGHPNPRRGIDSPSCSDVRVSPRRGIPAASRGHDPEAEARR